MPLLSRGLIIKSPSTREGHDANSSSLRIFLNNITIVLFLRFVYTHIYVRIGQGSGSAMNLAYRRDNPAFLAIYKYSAESRRGYLSRYARRNHRFPGNSQKNIAENARVVRLRNTTILQNRISTRTYI